MLPYLEITHTESHCHVGLCLIKPNTLWKLFELAVLDLTYPMSCRRRWMGESSHLECHVAVKGFIRPLAKCTVNLRSFT